MRWSLFVDETPNRRCICAVRSPPGAGYHQELHMLPALSSLPAQPVKDILRAQLRCLAPIDDPPPQVSAAPTSRSLPLPRIVVMRPTPNLLLRGSLRNTLCARNFPGFPTVRLIKMPVDRPCIFPRSRAPRFGPGKPAGPVLSAKK